MTRNGGNGRDIEHDASPASNLAAYALGALDAAEAEEVELYIEFNEDAARELDAMLETVAAVGMLVGTDEPSESLKQQILDAVEVESAAKRVDASVSLLTHIEREVANDAEPVTVDSRPWYQRLTHGIGFGKLAFATSMAALLVATIVAVQLGADNVALNRRVAETALSVQASTDYANMVLRELDDARAALNAAEVRMQQQATQIESMSESNDALRESFTDQISLTYATLQQQYQTPDWLPDSSAHSGGYMYLLESRFGPEAALVIGGVAPAPPGEEYRLYLTSGDTAEYVVSFNMNRVGYGTVTFPIPAPLSGYDGAHITRESVVDPPDPTLAEPANRYRPQ